MAMSAPHLILLSELQNPRTEKLGSCTKMHGHAHQCGYTPQTEVMESYSEKMELRLVYNTHTCGANGELYIKWPVYTRGPK